MKRWIVCLSDSNLLFTLTRWVCPVILCFALVQARGQSLHVSGGVEKTAKRFLVDGAVMLENQRKWGIGVTYQASVLNEGNEGIDLADVFYGMALQLPIAKTDKIDFFATARLGFVNENFFVILPGLETRIKTWRNLRTVFCMGYRVGYPSMGLKLSHPVF